MAVGERTQLAFGPLERKALNTIGVHHEQGFSRSGRSFTTIVEEDLPQGAGIAADAHFTSDKEGLAMCSTDMNRATKSLAGVGLPLLNEGRNNKGEQVLPGKFISDLCEGNDEVFSAWLICRRNSFPFF